MATNGTRNGSTRTARGAAPRVTSKAAKPAARPAAKPAAPHAAQPAKPAVRPSANGRTAGHANGVASKRDVRGTTATWTVKAGLAQMLKGGVIMDVVTAEQAEIAQEAGAVAVMALERVPADIRAAGGVARMSHVKKIKEIQAAVSIPVMAKARIGHFVEAQVLEALGVDYVDESEVLTPADDVHHIDKHRFAVPFVCGCRNLGEALRRISEGAAMIRTKGEAGTGDIVEAVRHMRSLWSEIRRVQGMREDEVWAAAKEMQVPVDLLRDVKRLGKLPVVNFSAGGVATPADAALMMQLGAEGVFVGSGIFKSAEDITDKKRKLDQQRRMAAAIVKAVTHFNDPKVIAAVSEEIPEEAMRGRSTATMPREELLAHRGS